MSDFLIFLVRNWCKMRSVPDNIENIGSEFFLNRRIRPLVSEAIKPRILSNFLISSISVPLLLEVLIQFEEGFDNVVFPRRGSLSLVTCVAGPNRSE